MTIIGNFQIHLYAEGLNAFRHEPFSFGRNYPASTRNRRRIIPIEMKPSILFYFNHPNFLLTNETTNPDVALNVQFLHVARAHKDHPLGDVRDPVADAL